jgi:hypothetical protein
MEIGQLCVHFGVLSSDEMDLEELRSGTSSSSVTVPRGSPPPSRRSKSTSPMDTKVWPCNPGLVPASACHQESESA